MKIAGIYLRGYGTFIAQFIGSLLIGIGLSAIVLPQTSSASTPPSTAATSYAYGAAKCGDCGSGASITGVEVQKRNGSVLFVLGGNWPASVDKLGTTGVHLVAGNVEIRLQPHGSENAFELTLATQGGKPMAAGSVAAGISGQYLIISVKGIDAPLLFHVALTTGSQDHDRVPAAGELSWDGTSAPAAASTSKPTATPGTSTPPTATPGTSTPPTATPAVMGFLTFVEACGSAIPSASVAPELRIVSTSTGRGQEPGDNAVVPYVDIALGESLPSATVPRQPFELVIAIQPAGSSAAPAAPKPTAIDGAGSIQLYALWDGQQINGMIRQRTGSGPWSEHAAPFTVTFTGSHARFYWSGFTAASTIGAVTANPQGCGFMQVG